MEALEVMRANLPHILISGTKVEAARAQLLYTKCRVAAAASTQRQSDGEARVILPYATFIVMCIICLILFSNQRMSQDAQQGEAGFYHM